MAFVPAPGTPSYSGTFTPEIWAKTLLIKFYEATVLTAIANTDYEGEISKYGDKVIIRTRPDIDIFDYVPGQSLPIQHPESDNVELLIDKAKGFNAILDDIQKVQNDINAFEVWNADASEQMKIAIDTDVLGSIYADVHASNTGATAGVKSASFNLGVSGTPLGLTKDNILDYIVDCGTVLDEQMVPPTGRWMILPHWATGLIKKSELRDASLSGDQTSIMRNGRLGQIDRFTIYESALLASGADGSVTAYNALFGHKAALTFASQMTEMETLRVQTTFGNLMRGLQVYGYEVVKPEALGRLYCYKA